LRWQVGRPPPSGKGKVARKHAYRPGQTRERIPSNAWARKIAAPTKPITAVIVSIIANVPLRPCATENGGHLAQSKRFPGANTQSRSTEDFAQQTWIFCDPVAGAAVIGAPGAAHECPLEAAREDGAKHQATPNRGGEISSESMLIFRRELRFERGRRREHRH